MMYTWHGFPHVNMGAVSAWSEPRHEHARRASLPAWRGLVLDTEQRAEHPRLVRCRRVEGRAVTANVTAILIPTTSSIDVGACFTSCCAHAHLSVRRMSECARECARMPVGVCQPCE